VDVDKLELVDNVVADDEEVLLGRVLLLDNVEGEILEVVVLDSVVVLDVELMVLMDELESEVVVEGIIEELVAATDQNVIKANLLKHGNARLKRWEDPKN
jgi:hypothetical protein